MNINMKNNNMKNNNKETKKFEDLIIKSERKKSDNERWAGFEHSLKYLLCELNVAASMEDVMLLNDINTTVIIFAMKDKFKETDETFLINTKNCFYTSIENLEKRHADIKNKTFIIKLFMEDFYFTK